MLGILVKKLINSELIIVDDAGHSMSEKGITIKLLDSVEKLEIFKIIYKNNFIKFIVRFLQYY